MIEPWTTERTHLAFGDKWIQVRSDQCRRADGHVIEPYYVIEQSEWVSILALTPKDEVVLVKEYHHGVGVVSTGLPGGAAKAGETASSAALRELLEETGYEPGELTLLGSGYANWGNQDNQIFYYLASDCRLVQEQALDENEEIEVVLMSLDLVLEPGYLKQSYHLANLFLAAPHLQQRSRR